MVETYLWLSEVVPQILLHTAEVEGSSPFRVATAKQSSFEEKL